jgi:hypothetical protein
MPYEPVEDILNIERVKINATKSDLFMRKIIISTYFAVKDPSNFKQPSSYKGIIVSY